MAPGHRPCLPVRSGAGGGAAVVPVEHAVAVRAVRELPKNPAKYFQPQGGVIRVVGAS